MMTMKRLEIVMVLVVLMLMLSTSNQRRAAGKLLLSKEGGTPHLLVLRIHNYVLIVHNLCISYL